MDNYFTMPKVIGVLGTEGFGPGWPGQNFKEIDNSQIDFNEIFWSVD